MCHELAPLLYATEPARLTHDVNSSGASGGGAIHGAIIVARHKRHPGEGRDPVHGAKRCAISIASSALMHRCE